MLDLAWFLFEFVMRLPKSIFKMKICMIFKKYIATNPHLGFEFGMLQYGSLFNVMLKNLHNLFYLNQNI